MSELTKKKELNVGITDELKDFLNDWTKKTFESAEKITEDKKIGIEARQMVVNITKREIDKIDKELNKEGIEDKEWFKLIEKIDKLSDLVRFY